MKEIDIGGSGRLAFQMDLLARSSTVKNPAEQVRLFLRGLRNLYGRRAALLLSTRELSPGQYKLCAHLDEDGVDLIAAVDPWSGEGLAKREGGFLADVIRTATPRLLHELDVAHDPTLGAMFAPYGSLMAAPLLDGGLALNWLILLHPGGCGFTVADLEEFNLRANLVGSIVNHLRTERQLHDAHRAIRREVERIACIQRSLLPAELPNIDGLRLAASYGTYDEAGGDLYDVRPARLGPHSTPDLWSLLVADASGHGPAAAVMTAVLDALLRAYCNEPPSPGDMLAYANRLLCGKRLNGSFVTAFLAFYEPATRMLAYASAGHNPPLLRTRPSAGRDGLAYLNNVSGLPLGIECDLHYDVASVRLEPGQVLLLYTDGICEAMSPSSQLLGMEPVERILSESQADPSALLETLAIMLREHENGRRPSDDQTLLVAQVV